jgi:nitrogen fixation NifU-like protein
MGLSEIYTEIIMEHNKSKHNKGDLKEADHSIRGHNPNCGDDITLHLNIEEGIITEMKYSGVGCAISEASTSIMIDLLKGESVEMVKEKVKLFIGMIKDEVPDDVAEEELLDASILSNIKTMPARVKCAVLAWHALEQGIIQAEEEVK